MTNEIAVKDKNELLNNQNQFTKKDVEDIVDTVQGGFYVVGKDKRVPDSKLVSCLANAKEISTLEPIIKKTSEFCEVTATAVSPTGQQRTGSVKYLYADVIQERLLAMLESDKEAEKKFKSSKFNENKEFKPAYFNDLKNPMSVDFSTGEMTPNLTERGQLKIVRDMINFKKTAERSAGTKAERVAFLKILNQEWREPEEIKHEEEEVVSVNNGKKVHYEEVGENEEPKNTKKEKETPKKDKTNQTVTDATDLDTPEKVYNRTIERLTAKNFPKTDKNIKFNANKLLQEANIKVDEEFINKVMDLHKNSSS
nr:hypothetical protein [Methanobrevibacter arboriphilus]